MGREGKLVSRGNGLDDWSVFWDNEGGSSCSTAVCFVRHVPSLYTRIEVALLYFSCVVLS